MHCGDMHCGDIRTEMVEQEICFLTLALPKPFWTLVNSVVWTTLARTEVDVIAHVPHVNALLLRNPCNIALSHIYTAQN